MLTAIALATEVVRIRVLFRGFEEPALPVSAPADLLSRNRSMTARRLLETDFLAREASGDTFGVQTLAS